MALSSFREIIFLSTPSLRLAVCPQSDSPGNTSPAIDENNDVVLINKTKCMCSPTRHPGSFRCSIHKSSSGRGGRDHNTTSIHCSNRLCCRRSAMTNSLVRIGVEGDLAKIALSALIKTTSHNNRRRRDFRRRPSRLSRMSKA